MGVEKREAGTVVCLKPVKEVYWDVEIKVPVMPIKGMKYIQRTIIAIVETVLQECDFGTRCYTPAQLSYRDSTSYYTVRSYVHLHC